MNMKEDIEKDKLISIVPQNQWSSSGERALALFFFDKQALNEQVNCATETSDPADDLESYYTHQSLLLSEN